jgi:hypothetical protein
MESDKLETLFLLLHGEQHMRNGLRLAGCGMLVGVIACWSLVGVGQDASAAHSADTPAVPSTSAPLSVDEVVRNLQQRNAERSAALEKYESTRVYGMRYRGFPSDHSADMVVHMDYQAPSSKEFSIVSQSGLKFIIDHVFKKLLEAEKEAAANEESRRRTALTAENYNFSMAGFEPSQEGGQYVLNLAPKVKNKFLYRGKIWVDAKDFAVVKIKGEPGVNPSFFIKKTDIEHTYQKVGDFWLPAENRTESVIRLGGVAHLSIEYKDYKILKAEALNHSEAALAK